MSLLSLLVSSVDCLDPMCSGHGTCHHGECHCNPGWGGISCDILKSTCPEQCSSHGTFNTDSGVCICEANWTGADCSIGQNRFYLFIFGSLLQQKLQLHIGFEHICLSNSKVWWNRSRKHVFVCKVKELVACSFLLSIPILSFLLTQTPWLTLPNLENSININ